MKTSTSFSKLKIIAAVSFAYCSSLLIPCSAQILHMYGMTTRGGVNDSGSVFLFTPSTKAETVTHSFAGATSDGQTPLGNLAYNFNNGLFYGMTEYGGTDDAGAIISFDPSTSNEHLVYSFKNIGGDGWNPYATLAFDANNNLFYGTTYNGGTHNKGTIFSFDPGSNTETVVWSFGNDTDGGGPTGNLVYDGFLYYATTSYGGGNGYGAIIGFNPSGNTENVVWSFGKGSDGSGAGGDLIYDQYTSLFYGMTQYGGANSKGAIFSFNPTGNVETLLWSFGTGTDGKYPDKNLIYDANSNLFYGTTLDGGTNDDGTIISLNPNGNTENVIWSFGNGSDGQSPFGDLLYDAGDTAFYGTTFGGGTNLMGTIYKFKSGVDTENVVWNFGAGTDGASPKGDLVLYSGSTGINTINNLTSSITIYPNPNNGSFTIRLQNVKQNTELEIFNVLGESVYTKNLKSTNTPVNLNDHAPGIYLYRVLDGRGNQIGDGKFVIE